MKAVPVDYSLDDVFSTQQQKKKIYHCGISKAVIQDGRRPNYPMPIRWKLSTLEGFIGGNWIYCIWFLFQIRVKFGPLLIRFI